MKNKRRKKKLFFAKIVLILALLLIGGTVAVVSNHLKSENSMVNNETEHTEANMRNDSVLHMEESEAPMLPKRTETSVQEDIVQESTAQEPSVEERIEAIISHMELEDKVAQLFVVLPEAMIDAGTVTAAGEMTQNAINKTPVGGFIYMEGNLISDEQVKTMLKNVQQYSLERIGLPAFLCIDEEGGSVTRISGTGKFSVPEITDMAVIGAIGDAKMAYDIGQQMGNYLAELGFNVNFAPDADVLSNPDNRVVSKRSFGSNPKVVTDMTMSLAKGLQANGVCATYKHFPGHGATTGDTHDGYAYTNKSLAELQDCELIPFERAVTDDIPFIMVGHISTPTITGDNIPASLSHTMITEVLRQQMGYDGIVITDAFNMGAVMQNYSSERAAIQAINAGVDIILMPADFESAYHGVLKAVENGELPEERINESLTRILKVKLQMKE